MVTEEGRIKKELISKEEQLFDNSIRNDANKIAELIHDNAIEITASGEQSRYQNGDLFGNVDGISYIDSNTVQLIHLSDDCKLLVYIAAKVNKNVRSKTNNSSIWKKNDGKWKIVFHQGTAHID
jgi:hypothetical protein